MTRTSPPLPTTSAQEVAWRVRVSGGGSSGGDFAVVIRLPDGRVGLGVGDVAGHGGRAAGLMRRLRDAMADTGATGAAPAAVLARLNLLLTALDEEATATAAYAVVDPATGTVVSSSAGHLPFLCVTGAGACTMQSSLGPPLGVSDETTYDDRIAAVPAGATLLAYTDGLVERRGEDIDVGLGRLTRAACLPGTSSLRTRVDAVFTSLVTASSDDATLVGLRL